MKILALLISYAITYPTALAGDAPLRTAEGDALATLDQDAVLFIAPIRKGEPSPVDGRVMDTVSYIAIARRTASAEAERDALRAGPTNAQQGLSVVLLLIGAVGGGLALGWSLHARLVPK